jgi:dipeptidase E
LWIKHAKTNDIPIIYPQLSNIRIIPFINAHYLDLIHNPNIWETRETRIKEFHSFNTIPVLGLREGSWLDVKETKLC